ncbi:protein of unknown function DUF81 [Methanobacterium lacus]|uniref:Probable membrane transporter protein n=1 Tax=Methanobacterium lacus (strain AL-21) TaxID=877455 RepID=F0T859_METLA|nr:sulfite exporter TauE/SafE family protein [Methanobacterium lacus]ADZ09685.1 protein of unknown function DUF81 [Methanobacterium lacus]
MIDYTLIFLPFVGFLIGLLVTTLGGGGGGLYVPILTLLGVAPQVAVATSLATVLPTTAVGAYSHNRKGNVDVKTGIILGIGGIIGTLIGAYVANLIPPNLLKKGLGLLLLIFAIPMIRRFIGVYKKSKTPKEEHHEIEENLSEDPDRETLKLTGPKRIFASLFGVAGGVLAGVFGLSGTPPISAGLYSLGLPTLMVVGTTVFVLVFNSLAGIGGYLFLGRFDVVLTVLLGGGAVVGSFLGPKLLEKAGKELVEKFIPPVLIGISVIFGLALIF